MPDVAARETPAIGARFVLKDGDGYLIADAHGDIHGGADGLFLDDTRLLSRLRLALNGVRPELLSGGIASDNVRFVAHLTNLPLPPLGADIVPPGILHIERTRLLWGECLYERLICTNYGDSHARALLRLDYAADFRDMFEVRGSVRPARGELLPPETGSDRVRFSYRGLDGALRQSLLCFSRAPQRLDGEGAEFALSLPPEASDVLYFEVGPAAQVPSIERFRRAATSARVAMRARLRRGAGVRSSAPLFNAWLARSRADLALLTSELETGPYPYAGIPWFSTPFGRDAVITALQTLWLDPGLARGVLAFLARHQAHEDSSVLDASPGKIMHETRKGEMAALRELPFGRYYGGVDTTPLFVLLAGAYADRTGDLGFIEGLWPALLAAVGWIERVCDANPNGLLDYARGESTGLANQGWKDSEASVFHADGRLPPGPIALVEVQGYAYAGLRMMARMALKRGEPAHAIRWRRRAQRLRTTVERLYWMPQRNFYGLAIDGEGTLCEVLASNAGHLLYVGLPTAERAAAVMARLLSPPFDSGWGLRTLATGQPRYNPMSYHNGSIWPHDTALCAAGFSRYGARDGAVRLLTQIFEAAVHFDLRLPELFCGFPRTGSAAPPVAYPVACLPQAWAAGSAFMLLQACLGLEVDAWRRRIVVEQPQLPPGIEQVSVRDIALGAYRVDLLVQRVGGRVGVFLEGRDAGRVPLLLRG
jgi:glycogen debranching enzyme